MLVVFAKNNTIPSRLIRLVTWSRWHHYGALTDDSKHIIKATTLHWLVKALINDFLSRYTKTATIWRTEAGFNAENAGRNVHIQDAKKYRIDMNSKKSGNYEVRVTLLDADFTVELI
tara:strand:+ start:2525 stop:2875 length:351 start_codon:yes stop_codon:yes gene_type:complete